MILTKNYYKKGPFFLFCPFFILRVPPGGVMNTCTYLIPNILWISHLTLNFYTLFRSRDIKNKKLLHENCILPIFQYLTPPPHLAQTMAWFFSKFDRFMLHIITCLHAKNNKVASGRHVEFGIFTKLGIFGPLEAHSDEISEVIGPVFELNWHLTHIKFIKYT